MLDVKGARASTARALVRALQERGIDRPLLVCGRWWPSVETVAELPFVRPVLSARNRVELARLRRRVDEWPSAYGVSVHMSLLDAAIVAELHRHVEVVMTWPVNDLASLDAMLRIGVTGIISDEPSRPGRAGPARGRPWLTQGAACGRGALRRIHRCPPPPPPQSRCRAW